MYRQGPGYSTLQGTFARPAALLDCRVRVHDPAFHHQRSRLYTRAAIEEQSSRPLRQQLTALFSAAALLASGLSAGAQQAEFGNAAHVCTELHCHCRSQLCPRQQPYISELAQRLRLRQTYTSAATVCVLYRVYHRAPQQSCQQACCSSHWSQKTMSTVNIATSTS